MMSINIFSFLFLSLCLCFTCCKATLQKVFHSSLVDAHSITDLKEFINHELKICSSCSVPFLSCGPIRNNVTIDKLRHNVFKDSVVNIAAVKHESNEICYLIHSSYENVQKIHRSSF